MLLIKAENTTPALDNLPQSDYENMNFSPECIYRYQPMKCNASHQSEWAGLQESTCQVSSGITAADFFPTVICSTGGKKAAAAPFFLDFPPE